MRSASVSRTCSSRRAIGSELSKDEAQVQDGGTLVRELGPGGVVLKLVCDLISSTKGAGDAKALSPHVMAHIQKQLRNPAGQITMLM